MMDHDDSDDSGLNDGDRYRRKFSSKQAQADADEKVIVEMKSKVKKKKGRGLHEKPGLRNNFSCDYERVRHSSEENDDDEFEDNNFPQRSVEGWILMVTNLHEEIQEEDIMDKFGDYGAVKNMHLNLDRRTGFVKGYCLIEFETYREALLAKEAMNDSNILGHTISVDWVFVKNPRKISVSESKKHRRNRH